MSALFAPDDEVFRLFDPAEMDHVCELVADAYEPHPARYFSEIGMSLHDLALHPLHLFVERAMATGRRRVVGIDEAQRLRMVLAGIVDEFVHRPTRTKSQAETNAEALRAAWLEFIARSAGYRMFADLPAEMAREEKISKGKSDNAKQPRPKARKADPQVLWDAFSASVAAGESKGTARGVLKRRFPYLSSSTIYRHTLGPPPKEPVH